MAERRPRAGAKKRAAVLLAALVVASGCAGGRGPGADGVRLRIGVSPDYPPLAYRLDGDLTGIEVVLAHELARELGRRPEFVELARDALIPTLEARQIDVIMSGLSITPEREERVLFATPYLHLGQLALIRKADLALFGRPRAMQRAGARVGFIRGTTGEAYVIGQLPRSEAYAFDSIDDGLRSLRAGRVDYFIHDAPTIWRVAGSPQEHDLMGLYEPLTHESVAWAVARDDLQLKQQIDAVLARWRAEGQLDPILNEWIPVRVRVGR